MSGRNKPFSVASLSEGLSSTPVKNNQDKEFDHGVLSDDEDTFSLLSPIYQDSFDSDDEDVEPPSADRSPNRADRCELPRTPSAQPFIKAVQSLSAWELWLVNKAKQERIQLEKKAEEACLLKQKLEEQEMEQEQKKVFVAEKIDEWLKTKQEQERNEQILKQNKEVEATQRRLEKKREIQKKADEKYKDWLHKKNQEKSEKEKKEKEEAALTAEQERGRRQKAEETFKEWVTKTNEKSRTGPKHPLPPKSRHGEPYPSPGFYNPIPWKPIHTPPPEPTAIQKPQQQKKKLQRNNSDVRGRKGLSSAHLVQKR